MEGEAVRELLRQGWRASWRRPDLRPKAAVALDGWCAAAENSALPHAPFKHVISVIFDEESHALGDDLNHIIGGHSPIRLELRRQYTETVFQAGAAPGILATAPPAQ